MIGFIQKTGFMGGSDLQPLPEATTMNFTSAQFVPGFSGSTSTTKNAGRIYGRASLTLWCGFITGTDATIQADSDYGAQDTLIQVSIDGGDFVNASHSSTSYALFSGLTHAKRFVQIRFGSDFGDAPFVLASGNVLSVTGQPPALIPFTNWVNANSTAFSAALLDNASGYTPKLQAQKGIVYGSNVGSVRLRGAFRDIIVTLNGLRKFAVSKNGGVPVFYTLADESNNPAKAIRVPCDGSLATYNVWDDGNFRTQGGHFAVAADASLQSIGTVSRYDQYGDSITYGAGPGATSIDTETMRVASALGGIGSTYGVSGYVISQCKALIATLAPLKSITSADVAILAIGGNNLPDIDAGELADYDICIQQLLDAGYGKVLCRGILPSPDGVNTWATANAALQSVVTARADPKVLWIPTSTWTGYGTQDGTHPTAAGYTTLYSYVEPAYRAALGL